MVALYDDAATVACAALKLLGLDPAQTARWLAELAPQIGDARARGRRRPAPRRPAAPARRGRDRARRRPPRATNGAVLCQLKRGHCGSASAGRSGRARAASSRRCAASCRTRSALGVVTNDIYTTEDAEFLRSTGRPRRRPDRRRADRLLPAHRDPRRHHDQPRSRRGARARPGAAASSCSSNRAATTSPRSSARRSPTCRSSSSTSRAATTSRARAGPGIARADLLVINKTDLAPYVGSDVERMQSDAHARRGDLPVHALSLVQPPHAEPVAALDPCAARSLTKRAATCTPARSAPDPHPHQGCATSNSQRTQVATAEAAHLPRTAS